MTDSQGRHVSFKNAIIIMTSNLGSSQVFEEVIRERRKAMIMEVVRTSFRPEFVNRVDEYIIFDPLQLPEIKQIVKIQVNFIS